MLFTDEVEKFIPPRKGRGHVLRVIREVLFFEPKRRGTDLAHALEFMGRVSAAQGDRGGDFGFSSAAGSVAVTGRRSRADARPYTGALPPPFKPPCAWRIGGTMSWPCKSRTATNWNCPRWAG